MNMRDAKKLEPGAIVRESYRHSTLHPIHGIVIGKKYIKERHTAKILGGYKDERYDVIVHWTCEKAEIPSHRRGGGYNDYNRDRLQVRQQWELMVMSHG